MQIQVFMGTASDGKTSKLQAVQDRLEFTGESAPVIQAGAYGEDGLLEILEVRAAGGQREILVDDCSRQQILRVLAWQSCVEHEPDFNGLVIHLARKD
ncbi:MULTISPECIES: hypothetical protein [Pseudomonas]|uniref:hypothetical protein n=1 Tax=Pseudomonas TaxID=286 RepID=UPI00049A0C0A|nr:MULTISPECIES: hypothetical protein [Pseudomonas]AIB43421.1 hypothetical protein PD374_20580 [Pseudomonas sp. WCS374]MDI3183540.1 hypothetical protein [Pseudomonas paracarnis]PTT08567.1 hypothetical protein DBR14_22525 [Pseudomonas sp. HMWF034]PVV77682.1 hypothetical protein DD985_03065 [Pseudomonas sp. HMWF011]